MASPIAGSIASATAMFPGLGQVIEVDIDGLPLFVKKRRQIDGIGRIGQFGTIAAFGNDCP